MKNKLLVWDLPVRLFHWCLVISLFAAWYTSDGERNLIDWHLKIGYFILGLIIFRIIWGVFGTRYAKFTQFIPNKKALLHYLKNFRQEKNYTTVGHNPLGGLMVVLMLTLVLSQAISGLFMNDDIFTSGPYYASASSSIQSIMSLIHHNVFDIIIIVSVLHISAAFYYLLVKKANLIVPMITGYKSSDSAENKKGIKSSKLFVALVIILVVAVFLYWLLVLNVPVEEEFYY
ncbi:cytochrome b/b6 domain-containing protein [Colwellia sp. 4_MG-2023]|jgi:cytochrome b|uniref:cytochrome b/b6 domain-containing protein n=1 Tax=unclassified Colwellia TaxID=196834 RepID=UPI001C0A2864|nr:MULTISPECIES: cytochrome b/b6 domain-containing protein [unclassified Colwellia]MBU2925607.1 cytochrome b/b6 domain-containing protein [Colwellia sp. C2M11]MDO6489707.1 cytochrome b/b6 domain-containing protein [Colwellia sp. 6_MG-2023]MDO6508845.1 cytochrome b/b6 domain-containing protein [Colwellia sp. 5_MG-2023]MDO6557525.1 cytochrome b/b6 domain-containing protein [Colwellia sp. 4_MG-2023]MDO6654212.1 cytochrome b/b6 domain-containing protein [Colwellia sp. 3_MG-2023]